MFIASYMCSMWPDKSCEISVTALFTAACSVCLSACLSVHLSTLNQQCCSIHHSHRSVYSVTLPEMISATVRRSHELLLALTLPMVAPRTRAKVPKFLIDSKRQAWKEKSNFLIDSLSCKCTILIASQSFVLWKKEKKKSLVHGQKKAGDVTAKWLQAGP